MSYRITTEHGHSYVNAKGHPVGTNLRETAKRYCQNSLKTCEWVELYGENTGTRYVRGSISTPRWSLIKRYTRQDPPFVDSELPVILIRDELGNK